MFAKPVNSTSPVPLAQRNKVLSERCVHLKNGIPAMEERAAKAEEEIGDIEKQQKEVTKAFR